jgi:predicted lipoprotein with Yx(FWY)xxD motif
VASFARSDGLGSQVTFNGMPLYYWQGDKAAGDTTGQGINQFSVASPGGAAPASAAPTGTYKYTY